jgi:hypothetical protein
MAGDQIIGFASAVHDARLNFNDTTVQPNALVADVLAAKIELARVSKAARRFMLAIH